MRTSAATPAGTPPPPSESAVEARAAFGELYAQLESFLRGVLMLDPQEAAIRAGLSILVLVIALVLLVATRLALKALAARLSPPPAEGAPNKKKAPIRLAGWTMPVLRITVFVAAVLLVMQIWGVPLAAVMEGPFGAILRLLGRAAIIIVVMLAAIEIVQIAIARVFARIAKNSRDARRAGQLRTIAPVVSGTVTAVLFVITTMMVLGQIGVEIGPLLAGAGIVGLAVGFGAQTLVKDFLTGIFLIVEDVVSIGDVVRIGEASGSVEDMSLRTIKLRAFDGTLQVIPYGEAQIVFNMTKGFSFYVLNLSISYSSDIARALDIMKTTGDQLQQDERFGAMILEPIEIVGVDALADSAVMLKGRIKTAPGKQWSVGREYLKRIKVAFDEGGIEIPFPHMQLVPAPTPTEPPPR